MRPVKDMGASDAEPESTAIVRARVGALHRSLVTVRGWIAPCGLAWAVANLCESAGGMTTGHRELRGPRLSRPERVSERLRYHFTLTLRVNLPYRALHLSTAAPLSTDLPACPRPRSPVPAA